MPPSLTMLHRHWLVLLVVAATLILRRLELRGLDLQTYFALSPTSEYFGAPWWKMFLPLDHGQGLMSWTTTGLVLTTPLDLAIGTKATFTLMNIVLVIVTYAVTWPVYRSRTFSLTLALLMGLGSQLTYAYVMPSLVKYFLLLSYLQVNLVCLILAMRGESGTRLLFPTFVASLVALALCSEIWLDYCLFLLVALAYCYWLQRKVVLVRFGVATVVVLVAYLSVRMFYVQEHFIYGKESEVVFKYLFPLEDGAARFRPELALLAVEDVISNVFTYVYLAFSNFLPPPLVGSNSLIAFGKSRIIAEQYGYHAAQTELVYYHHLFYWYFFAGTFLLALLGGLVASVRADRARLADPAPVLTWLMLLVLCGFFTHAVIKYRPYLSSPVFTYKAIVSVTGVAWLIAYGMMRLRDRLAWRRFRWVAVLLVALVCWNAVARPSALSRLSTAVGMSGFPSPLQNLRSLLRL